MTQQWQKSRTVVEAARHAIDGVRHAWRHEKNIRIQCAVYVVALLVGLLTGLPATSLALIVLVASFIVCLELVNTSLENLSNSISPQYHETLRSVKDMAAGAVLIGSIGAVIIGLLVFIPELV